MAEQGDGGAIVNVGTRSAVDAIGDPTSACSAARPDATCWPEPGGELAPRATRVNTVALASVETPACSGS